VDKLRRFGCSAIPKYANRRRSFFGWNSRSSSSPFAGGLGEDICDVGCAVGNVRYDRQEEKAQPEIQREYCLGRGISGGEVDDYDGRERKVVNEPPTFPEFNGASDILAHVGVHGNKSNLI
jgi:hypothetical protein